MAGTVVLTGVDLSISPRALFGDMLALLGGALAAAYVTVGAEARRTVSTTVYATACYGVAAVALLAVCGVGRQSLAGYDGRTWLLLVATVLGPQLLGHTLVNRVLATISPVIVSVAILFEIVGAALLAWLAFDEVPPASADSGGGADRRRRRPRRAGQPRRACCGGLAADRMTVPLAPRRGRYGPLVRLVWIVALVLLVVGLAAWSTTCTGPRPQPTGETIPPGTAVTTVAPGG